MIMNDNSWYLVRSIPSVLGFLVSASNNPIPIKNKEIKVLMDRLQEINGQPIPNILFELGELVRVNDGPFSDFYGVVEEIDYVKHSLKITLSIFGRSTPVLLDFSQVEKK